MMKAWEEFEIDATRFLNDTYGEFAIFTHEGGADSTLPDILVETNNGHEFYIEAKLSKAQCGQFVLQADNNSNTFRYTARNTINEYAIEIMNFMNHNFEEFKEVGTAGKEIEMNPNVFADWIINTYAKKGVRWFISEDYVLIPIDKFGEFFDVSATYRVKKSGSSPVGKTRVNEIVSVIKALDISTDITDYNISNDKLFVESNTNIDKVRFSYGGFDYMFSKRGDVYELRKLSRTFNANVIFSVSLKNKTDKYQKEFVSYLKD